MTRRPERHAHIRKDITPCEQGCARTRVVCSRPAHVSIARPGIRSMKSAPRVLGDGEGWKSGQDIDLEASCNTEATPWGEGSTRPCSTTVSLCQAHYPGGDKASPGGVSGADGACETDTGRARYICSLDLFRSSLNHTSITSRPHPASHPS
ncbi:hypothetical protein CALCODRAFT_155048 [Calocera cornea HHB12733]|uniref:Uncharacterized protein n=1 Tax=Calocera cornea HHB12733 TaxID=1353952 RepID=A0A165CLY7_9BASI|nr:hypothetical protein CALCODRAFT_155048 [Calocera cornea HHB12733]